MRPRTNSLLGVQYADKQSGEDIRRIAGDMSTLLGGGITLDNLNGELLELYASVPAPVWHTVGATGEPAYETGWSAGDLSGARFRAEPNGIIRLSGAVDGGTPGATAFTLPEGYRPPYAVRFASTNDGAYDEIRISTAGAVVPQIGSTEVTLDGITFPADSAASPEVWSGGEWPLVLQTRLTQVESVWLLQALDQDASKIRSAPSAQPDWEFAPTTQGGNVKIKSLWGLAPGRRYRLRFFLLGK